MAHQVQLKFLGTGSILPQPDRYCSSFLLETAKEKILVDAGPGTLHRLHQAGISPPDLTYIFISHFHPDHVSDLVPIIFAIKNTPSEFHHNALRIWGPRGFINFLHGMEIAYGKWLRSSGNHFKYYELKRRLLDFPGFRLIWDKVLHKSESVGYRFELNQKIISYSGDTGFSSQVIRLCQDADIAILDCSYPDELAVEGHLSPSLAGKIASDANAKKLILTHFYPGTTHSDIITVAKKFYDGPVELAEDLKAYVLE
jgi:ribonuclease BN (tRNA processing enzyme)